MAGTVALPGRVDSTDHPVSTGGFAGGAAGYVALPSTRYYTPPTVPQGRSVGGPVLAKLLVWWRQNIMPVTDGLVATETAEQAGTVDYVRGRYDNTGGLHMDNPPAGAFNPRTSRVGSNGPPLYPITTSEKDLDGRSEVRQFGVWSQRYPSGPLVDLNPIPSPPGSPEEPTWPEYFRPRVQMKAQPRLSIQKSIQAILTRSGAIPQMTGPYYPLLTQLAPASSYGQMTHVLPAVPGGNSGSVYGA